MSVVELLIHACFCAGRNMLANIVQRAFMQKHSLMSAMLVQLLENKALERVVILNT